MSGHVLEVHERTNFFDNLARFRLQLLLFIVGEDQLGTNSDMQDHYGNGQHDRDRQQQRQGQGRRDPHTFVGRASQKPVYGKNQRHQDQTGNRRCENSAHRPAVGINNAFRTRLAISAMVEMTIISLPFSATQM